MGAWWSDSSWSTPLVRCGPIGPSPPERADEALMCLPKLLVFGGLNVLVDNEAGCLRCMVTGNFDTLEFPAIADFIAACRTADPSIALLTVEDHRAAANLVSRSQVPSIHAISRLANTDGGNACETYREATS